MQAIKLWMLGVLMIFVLLLAGCTTSTPASVAGLRAVLGDELPGAMGKTKEDQRKIDRTVASGCKTNIYSIAKCGEHTRASTDRYKELSNGAE